MEPAYQPIDCSLHDRLESLATLGTECLVVFRDERGESREVTGRITDVFARDGAEFLSLTPALTVRLDRIDSVAPLRRNGDR